MSRLLHSNASAPLCTVSMRCRVLGVVALVWLHIGPLGSQAQAQADYTGSGTVAPGRCSGADVFTDSAGQRFEVDRARTVIPAYIPVKVVGSVYKRISVCKEFPWLEVRSFTPNGATLSPSSAPKAQPGTLTLAVGAQDVQYFGQLVRALGKRTDIAQVNVFMSEAAAAALPEILLDLARDDAEAFAKVEISVDSSQKPQFVWSSDRGTIKYNSLLEMRNAMALH